MAIELSRTHPWPGLATYEEEAQAYFFGREHETQALVRQIRMAPLTVLYGRSGLGKSSLLKAGVFPQLRAQCYLPVYLRLTYGANARIDPVDQIAERLAEEIAAAGLDGPRRGPTETLWHWLHRKEFELWSADNRLWTPVLVFDQFEELFTRTEGNVRLIARVFDALADLAENRIEEAVANDRGGRDDMDLISQRYRMLLSFREDFLPDVRAWERQVPSLLRNDLRLVAMSGDQAVGAVQSAAGELLAPGAAKRLVEFVGALAASTRSVESSHTTLSGPRAQLTIEPALLSLCGAQLARRVAPGQKIDGTLLSQVGFDILEGFYRDALNGMPDSVQQFIEDYLLQGDRTRGSYARDEALAQGYISSQQLAALTEERRLLRVAQEGGVPRIELIHDRLVDVVKGARDRRNAVRQTEAARERERREAKEKLAAEQAARLQVETRARAQAEANAARMTKKNTWLGGLTAVMLIALGVVIWQYHVSERQKVELERQKVDLQSQLVKYEGMLKAHLIVNSKQTAFETAVEAFSRMGDALTAVRLWGERTGDRAGGLTQVLQAHEALVGLTSKLAPATGNPGGVKVTVNYPLGAEESSPQWDLLRQSLPDSRFIAKRQGRSSEAGSAIVLVGPNVSDDAVRMVVLGLVRASVPVRAAQQSGTDNRSAYPDRERPGPGTIFVLPRPPLAASDPPPLTVTEILGNNFIR